MLDPSAPSSEQCQQGVQLIERFADVFSTKDDDYERTNLATHRIYTQNSSPIRQAPRRLLLAKQAEVADVIQNMQKQGIIERLNSPWTSPVVLDPVDYDADDWDRELAYDFDTEQSEVRYDPKLLSEELDDSLTRQRGASCNLSNIVYEHGEQVARNDPCEMCVCMDGEIFCYWRQCSGEISESISYASKEQEDDSESLEPYWKLAHSSHLSPAKHSKPAKHSATVKPAKVKNVLKPTKLPWVQKPLPPPSIVKPSKHVKAKKVHKTKKALKRPRKPARKRMKSKKVFSFPEHLPATLHFDLENMRRNDLPEDSVEASDESSESKSTTKTTTRPAGEEANTGVGRNSDVFAAATAKENIDSDKKPQSPTPDNAHSAQFQSSEKNISQSEPNANGWRGLSLYPSSSTITLSSSSPSSSLSSGQPTTMTTTQQAVSARSNGNNNDGSSSMQNKHINFQSGGIIPNDESVESEDDSAGSDDGDGGSVNGIGNTSDKKTEVEKDTIATTATDSDSDVENRRIQFVDVPLAKHYIITSSGSVENADILASENILSQFRNDYSIVSSDSMANNPSPPVLPAAPSNQFVSQPQTSTNRSESDVTIRADISTAIISNDAVEPASSASAATATIPVASVPATTATRALSLESGSVTAAAGTVQSAATQNPTFVAGGIIPAEVDSLASSAPQAFSSSTSQVSSLKQQQRSADASFLQLKGSATEQVQQTRQQECVVMGTSYSVGSILPQETGNCLQCVCTAGNGNDDSPRVTCSPHNCPPLVLPDLFDTTGY